MAEGKSDLQLQRIAQGRGGGLIDRRVRGFQWLHSSCLRQIEGVDKLLEFIREINTCDQITKFKDVEKEFSKICKDVVEKNEP